MAGDLWMTDIDGEVWLENPRPATKRNPELLLANRRKPKRRKKIMAAARKRRSTRRVTRRRKTVALNPRRRRRTTGRRRARRNSMTSGVIQNPRRRRRSTRRVARRTSRRMARRNPNLMGFGLPSLSDVLMVGSGLLVPPIVAAKLTPYLPASLQGSKIGFYGVKAASVLLPSFLVKKFVSKRAGNLMLLGGAASFAIDLIRETGVLASLGLGYYPSIGIPAGQGLGSQPMLGSMGRYPSVAAGSPVNRMEARMLSSVPSRLDPRERY